MKYNFTKIIKRAKRKQANKPEAFLNIQSQEQEAEKELNKSENG